MKNLLRAVVVLYITLSSGTLFAFANGDADNNFVVDCPFSMCGYPGSNMNNYYEYQDRADQYARDNNLGAGTHTIVVVNQDQDTYAVVHVTMNDSNQVTYSHTDGPKSGYNGGRGESNESDEK
ncbi:hypothetical protein [Aliikangiella coralliicola]|uniref:Uncharacterized protein n=1 Tax=Aliikangiella coralliicola TaxID=2592383 RepID=A0A545UCD4_9GAMM|nr:hypothetical protein [Aliikangiella coralliicola]TQV87128.1 hypothetical protein FLL46_15090 [Aliikangiella coralliicola]